MAIETIARLLYNLPNSSGVFLVFMLHGVTLYSPFSGRSIARISLIDGDEPLETGQLRRFSIEDGFDRLWSRQLKEQPIVVRLTDETELYVRIVGFPVEQASEGYLQVDEVLPNASPPRTEKPATLHSPRRRHRSFWQRLFGRKHRH